MLFNLIDEGCYPKSLVDVLVTLASIDGVFAILAFIQLMRIHSRNLQIGWTRQKVFHLMIGSSNVGYFLYFVLTLVAACKGWICWSHSCGFIVMACPKILFLASFLLLLSFWVDLCHQTNEDDDEEEGSSPREALLEKLKKSNSSGDRRRRCCSFLAIHVGSRQKVVILAIVLVFALMMASAVLIWIGMGKNPIDSFVVARVYVDIFAIAMLLLGGALACYGLMLSLKMRNVRSERASSEMWKFSTMQPKYSVTILIGVISRSMHGFTLNVFGNSLFSYPGVAGLTIVSVLCFMSSAFVALFTDIPMLYHWHQQSINGVYTSLLLILYYFIGSSVPSAFVLWVMRELPPSSVVNIQEPRIIAFISDNSRTVHPQRWTSAASLQNQVSRASPI